MWPPVAKPATNPWAPGLEISKGDRPARGGPSGRRARVGGGLVLGFRECQGGQPDPS